MHLLDLQNQHSACFRTKEEKQNCLLDFNFIHFPSNCFFLELGKMQLYVQ